jgi:hypothetical protein
MSHRAAAFHLNDVPNVGDGDPPRSQHDGRATREVDDGRLNANLARPTFQHQVDVVAKVLMHVCRGGRRDAAEAVRGRRGDRLAEFLQQLSRDGMRRNTDAYGRLPSRHEVFRFLRSPEDERKRPRPEALRQEFCRLCRFTPRECFGSRREVHDHRMIGGTALYRVEATHRLLARGVGAQAINGFGGESDEAAGAQDLRRAANLLVHSLSGAALRTASVCFTRKSESFF